MIQVYCEFQGGLQVLFNEQQIIQVELGDAASIQDLIRELEKNHVKRTPEMFTIENHKL
jgi:hypothetical protein